MDRQAGEDSVNDGNNGFEAASIYHSHRATGFVVIIALVAAWYIVRNMNYAKWEANRVKRSGFIEKKIDINGSTINYAEGPANGPALLLIHGQMTSWQSWSRVLPRLSKHFHIFAVDCYGHGRSAHIPEKYNANAIAADLQQFLKVVVGKPAILAGHSSGGLIAASIAANAPELTLGVILEDPPFFSSVHPRAEKSFNYVDLSTTAHNFLQSGETDFTSYYVNHAVIWDLFKGAKPWIQNQALRYRKKHPDEPLKLYFMPPVLNDLFAAMDPYDPRFAEAFYDNSFHQGFDHAETLQRINVPAVLIHTNWSYDGKGILLAAMDGDDAERARTLIKDVQFFKVDSGHGFHFEKADELSRIVLSFKKRLGIK